MKPAKRTSKLGLFGFLLLLAGSTLTSAQQIIGQLEGEDYTVRGDVSLATVEGRSLAVLGSGNEVNVRNGAALLHLFEGGEITFCGPMTVSLLKGSSGLTLALGTGQLYLRLPRPILVNLYTPQFIIGLMESLGNEREVALALDAAGTLSVKAVRGSVTLREQLGTGALVVPEGAEWQVKHGRLASADAVPGGCTCSPSAFAKRRPEVSGETRVETAVARPSERVQPETSPAEAPSKAPQEPKRETLVPSVAATVSSPLGRPDEIPRKESPAVEWQIIMPPLVYMPEKLNPAERVNSSAGDLFPFREALAMAKELRLQPAMFIGQVIPLSITETRVEVNRATAVLQADVQSRSAKKAGGFGAKLKGFFRRLFGGSRS